MTVIFACNLVEEDFVDPLSSPGACWRCSPYCQLYTLDATVTPVSHNWVYRNGVCSEDKLLYKMGIVNCLVYWLITMKISYIMDYFLIMSLSHDFSLELLQFLRFTTGVCTVPSAGGITVTFDAVDDAIFASTCLQALQLPRHLEDYETFKTGLVVAMEDKKPNFNVPWGLVWLSYCYIYLKNSKTNVWVEVKKTRVI